MTARTSIRRTAALAAALVVLALTPAVAHAAPLASVAILGPADGAQVWGVQSVELSGTADDTGTQVISRIELSPSVGTGFSLTPDGGGLVCDVARQSCTGTGSWTAIAVGDAQLTASLYVEGTAEPVATTTIGVTIVAPPPSISIASPAATSGLTGTVTLDATASTDALDTDVPDYLELRVDGSPVDTADCPAATKVCGGSLSWDSFPYVGDKTLTVRVHTVQGATNDAQITLPFDNPLPAVSIVVPSPTKGLVEVSVTAGTDAAVDEFPTQIVVAQGATTLGTVLCDGAPSHTCAGAVQWDATGLSGTFTLTATVSTTLAGRERSSSIDVDVSTPAPTVAITAPDGSAPVKGVVTVTAGAAVDPALVDDPATVEFFDDGVPIGTFDCTGPARDCTATVTWDTTLLTGTRTLTATVTTTLGATTTSDPVDVAVDNPAPTVEITDPVEATATTPGLITVSASGAVDPALTDSPATMEILVDGLVQAALTTTCAPAASTCPATFPLDLTGLDGAKAVVVRLTTTNGLQATDAFVLTVATPAPTAAITTTFVGDQKGVVPVGVGAATDVATSDFPGTIALYREAGATDVLVGTHTCSGTSSTCAGVVDWDATGLEDGTYELYARVTTTGSGVTSSAPASADSAPATGVSVVNPLPVVAFSPAAPGTITGQRSIGIAASTDAALTEYPATLELLVGGTSVGTVDCPPAVRTCTGSVPWDSTLIASGTRTLQARVVSTLGRTSLSSTATVTVSNPAMKVSITSPSSNAVVKTSPVGISVTASTTSPQTDRPRSITVSVGGVTKTANCTVSVSTYSCSRTLSFSTASWVGKRTVSVTVRSARPSAPTVLLRTATATRTVYGYSGTRVTISAPSVVTSGTAVTLTGKVVSTKTGAGVPGVPVRVVRDPALGTTASSIVTTSSTGRWSLRFTPRTNTRIAVTAVARKTSSGTTYLAASSTSATQPVRARMSCSVSSTTLAVGRRGSGSCSVPSLPVGTPLALRYILNGNVFTLATGTSRSETIPFSFTFQKKGTYYLRVDLGANARFVATRSGLMQVTVR